MLKKNINQNFISLIEYYKMIDLNMVLSNTPIVRFKKEENIDHVIGKNKKLDILKNKIKNIKNCILKKTANKMVFSTGNQDSKIMFIGESPEKPDNKTGRPFSGQGGELLNKMLSAISLNQKNCYITNIINYLIPENRKPTKEEIDRYLPYLKLHIKIIKPKILILLGSTVMQAIIGENKSISEERGKWLKIKINSSNLDTLITFHPNFLIQQPEQKKNSWTDLKLIREKLNFLKLS